MFDPECLKEEEEEAIHCVQTASKGLRGRICHAVWASLTMAIVYLQKLVDQLGIQ